VGERGPGGAWPLERLLKLFPSLSERADNRGSQLSGGEQQMLAIARALVSDPKVMLLRRAQPGASHPLVVARARRIIRLLREEGVAILLVEQNMKLAEAVADELHIMVKVACSTARPRPSSVRRKRPFGRAFSPCDRDTSRPKPVYCPASLNRHRGCRGHRAFSLKNTGKKRAQEEEQPMTRVHRMTVAER